MGASSALPLFPLLQASPPSCCLLVVRGSSQIAPKLRPACHTLERAPAAPPARQRHQPPPQGARLGRVPQLTPRTTALPPAARSPTVATTSDAAAPAVERQGSWMQSLQTWFAGTAPDKEPPGGGSVLTEWNKYSGGAAGGAAPASGSQLASAEEGGASSSGARGYLSSAIGLVSGVANSAAAAASGAASSVPSTTQWTYFAFFAGMGALFLAMAFFIFLPMIILAPAKFAMSFSIGSALMIASLGALKGWKVMFGHILSKERLPFAGAYFGSLLATLYVSLVMHSYLFSLLFCGAQLVTLVYYVASFFPGGASGAQSVVSFAGRGALSLGSASLRAVFSK